MVNEAIKQGYKRTEVGIIPEDWEVLRFRNYADSNKKWSITGGPFGSNLKTTDYTSQGIRIIQLQNIGDGVFINNIEIFTSKEKAEELLSCNIFSGEIILSKMGDPVARACFIPKKLKRCIMASDGIRLVVNEKRFNKKFVHDYINSNYFRKRAIEISTGTTRQRIGLPELKNLQVIAPPLQEQKKIAEVFSDTDELIQQLDKLIVKKKNIKQGAMQELLTGKKRLPGFDGEWETLLFGCLIEINKGQQLNKSELTATGEYPDWNGGIEPSGYTNKWNMIENTITISEGGNSCGFVNYCKQKFWCGGHCYALKITSTNLDKSFLFQLLKFKEKSIMSLRIGSGLPNIQKKNLNEFELFIPKDSKEQSTIAQVLSDMDAEIDELERKRDKYIMIKKGMMQQLLTGKIRLKWQN
jgi:type I restriction enzyme S subunit